MNLVALLNQLGSVAGVQPQIGDETVILKRVVNIRMKLDLKLELKLDLTQSERDRSVSESRPRPDGFRRRVTRDSPLAGTINFF